MWDDYMMVLEERGHTIDNYLYDEDEDEDEDKDKDIEEENYERDGDDNME